MMTKQSCIHTYTNRHGYCTKCNFQTIPTVDNARKELNSLLVSGENNKRLEELKRRLDYTNINTYICTQVKEVIYTANLKPFKYDCNYQ